MKSKSYKFLEENIDKINIMVNKNSKKYISCNVNCWNCIVAQECHIIICDKVDCYRCELQKKCNKFFNSYRPALTEEEFQKICEKFPEYFL